MMLGLGVAAVWGGEVARLLVTTAPSADAAVGRSMEAARSN